MNAQQRKELSSLILVVDQASSDIQDIIDQLDDDDHPLADAQADAIEIHDRLDDVLSSLREMQSDEEDKLDNMPESWRDGEKGQTLETIIDALSEAADSVDSAMTSLKTKGDRNDVVTGLSDAIDSIASAIDYINEAKDT